MIEIVFLFAFLFALLWVIHLLGSDGDDESRSGERRANGEPRWQYGRDMSYRDHAWSLYKQQGHTCNGCGGRFRFGYMHVDHKLPLSRGGGNERENLQMMCPPCNRSKSTMTMEEWTNSGQRLFRQRRSSSAPVTWVARRAQRNIWRGS